MKMLPERGRKSGVKKRQKRQNMPLPKNPSVKEKVKYKVKTGQKMPPLTPTRIKVKYLIHSFVGSLIESYHFHLYPP
jgi:hypothetical protein